MSEAAPLARTEAGAGHHAGSRHRALTYAVLGVLLACLFGATALLWWLYGGAVFAQIAVAALAICF